MARIRVDGHIHMPMISEMPSPPHSRRFGTVLGATAAALRAQGIDTPPGELMVPGGGSLVPGGADIAFARRLMGSQRYRDLTEGNWDRPTADPAEGANDV